MSETEGDAVITTSEIEQAARDFKSAIVNDDCLFLEDVDGRKEFIIFDGDDKARMTVYRDISVLQERNRALYSEPVDHKSEFRRIASFDPAFLDLYGYEHGMPLLWYYQKEYMPVLVKLAHDSDYRDFRTMPGNFLRRT